MRESELHRRAKKVVIEAKQIRLPDLFAWRFNDQIEIGTKYRDPKLQQPKMNINLPLDGLSYNVFSQEDLGIDSVLEEKPYFGFKPDIILHTLKGYIGIEILVKHKVNTKKLNEIRKSNLSVIEIDLKTVNSTISDSDLTNLILHEVVGKTWLHLGNLEAEFESVTEEIKRFERKQDLGKGFLSSFFDSWFLGEDHPSLPKGWKELDGKEKRPIVVDKRYPDDLEYFVESCPIALRKVKGKDMNLDICKQCNFHESIAEDLSHVVCKKVLWASSLPKSNSLI